MSQYARYPVISTTVTPVAANTRQSVLEANDLVRAYTWAGFGTKFERVTQIDNTSVSAAPGVIVRQSFSYTLVSGSYRLDAETWSIV